jgi:tRNA-splicing ligase RtcB (3'-phosphate/5'-hydroxy nucleic acid ligase)
MTNPTHIIGDHDEGTLEQMQDIAARAVHTALMPDGHRGYFMPIGGVAAYREQISVMGVGVDIACGNMAIQTNLTLEQVQGNLTQIADEIRDTISFGTGRTNKSVSAPDDHPLFKDERWYLYPGHAREQLRSMAREQIGTTGSGNHFVDVFVGDDEKIWVGVHFGSRGLGYKTAYGTMALAQGEKFNAKIKETECLLDLGSELGRTYWELMHLCGEYAYAGREWVARTVVQDILGASAMFEVHNNHNFAWHERHFGEQFVVVRKGATPAFPGQMGFVGGSMGDVSVVLEGTRSVDLQSPYSDVLDPETYDAQTKTLFSTIHGAGRVMSRRAAKGKTKGWGKNEVVVSPGAVSQSDMDQWLERHGVIRRGGGVDESPQVYRRLPEVLSQLGNTVQIHHTLRPLVVVMAGETDFDPYADWSMHIENTTVTRTITTTIEEPMVQMQLTKKEFILLSIMIGEIQTDDDYLGHLLDKMYEFFEGNFQIDETFDLALSLKGKFHMNPS